MKMTYPKSRPIDKSMQAVPENPSPTIDDRPTVYMNLEGDAAREACKLPKSGTAVIEYELKSVRAEKDMQTGKHTGSMVMRITSIEAEHEEPDEDDAAGGTGRPGVDAILGVGDGDADNMG